MYRPQPARIASCQRIGQIKIMIPMVTCIEEIREAKALIEEIKKELDENGCLQQGDQGWYHGRDCGLHL